MRRLVLLALGIFAAACGRDEVLVLTPPAGARDAGVDAALDASADALAEAADAPTPDTGDCSLLPTDQKCADRDECCSGLCDLDPTGTLTCRPATGCLDVGALCTHAGACCSLSCETAGDGSKRCNLGLCASTNSTCTDDADCCGHRCDGAQCSNSEALCAAAGESCDKNEQCCSGSCDTLATGQPRCALLQACRVRGETCVDSADCCSGRCVERGSLGLCEDLAQCTSADGKPCSRQVGEICKDDGECCSRKCSKTSQGPKRCAATGGCRARCEICTQDAECCTQKCVLGADGARRCAPPIACLPLGEICDTEAQCCATSSKPKCEDNPKGVGAKRCFDPNAQCMNDGAACTLASQCCGGHCVPNGGSLRCTSTCVADGAACTIRADCCGQFSDCLALDGQRKCAPVMR
mgnify:CR=1 FL=1